MEATMETSPDTSPATSLDRFYYLFLHSPDSIFIETLDGLVLDVNPAACRLHGVRREDLVGKHVEELIPPENIESARKSFEILADHPEQPIEGESRTADGHIIPVEIRASRVEHNGAPALLM